MTPDLMPWLASVLPASLAGFIVWSLKRYTSDAEMRDARLEAALKELGAKVERIHELDLLTQRLNMVDVEVLKARGRLHKLESTVGTIVVRLQERRPSGSWPRVDPPEEGE